MKNTLKILGIIFLIATTFLIAACGPVEEPDPVVTFDAGIGTFSGSKTVTVKSGDPVDRPTNNPTPPAPGIQQPTTAGFWKLATTDTTYTFSNWYLGNDEYNFSTPVTGNITLTAKYTTSGGDPTNMASQTINSGTDPFEKAINYVSTNGNATDQYVLLLDSNPNYVGQGLTMAKGNLKVKSFPGGQKTITSPNFSISGKVFLTIGPNALSNTDKPKLELEGIRLQGSGQETNNPLVQVQYGGTLILVDNVTITGHKNKATTPDGANGNGAAVNVYGGNLTMNSGTSITGNESTQNSSTTGNRNRVGGVYTFCPTGNTVNLIIDGGIIEENKCTSGNTTDLYATEGGIFTLKGATTIGEITINADGSPLTPATIIVNGLNNKVGSLSLRSSVAPSEVKNRWTNPALQVLSGPLDNDNKTTVPSEADVGKFDLGFFKGSSGEPMAITGFEIDTTSGKLKAKN